MKNTTPDAAVLQELKELTSRIFKICEQNNMPVVIGYSYELNRNEDGYSINKSITAYADEKTGAWDSTIAAAAMLLKVKDVPREVIGALKSLSVASDFARAMSEASKEKKPALNAGASPALHPGDAEVSDQTHHQRHDQ